MSHRVRTSPILRPGQWIVMADHGHPEAPITDFAIRDGELVGTLAPDPDGSIIYCHPDDESRLLDILAQLGEQVDVNGALTALRRAPRPRYRQRVRWRRKHGRPRGRGHTVSHVQVRTAAPRARATKETE